MIVLRMSYPGTEPAGPQGAMLKRSRGCRFNARAVASGLPAIEHRRVVLVGGAQKLLVAALLGHPGGGDVLRIDHADGRRRSEIPVAPSAYGAHRFGRQTLAVGRGDEGPADLRHAFNRRPHVAPELGKAAFAEEGSGRLVLGSPIAETHEGPVAGIAHDLGPSLLARERPAADMAGDDGVRPHRHARVEIPEAMGAQPHALGLEGRNGPWGQP